MGSFRGFVGGLLGKRGKSGVDSLVMDLLHADEEIWVGVVGGKYGYHWIFRQCPLCIMVTCLCRATIAAGKLNDLDEVALIVADSVYRLIRHRVRVINHY